MNLADALNLGCMCQTLSPDRLREQLETDPYGNIVAVLTEVVAIAWDTRAWYGSIAAQWLKHIPGSRFKDSHADVAQLKVC